MEHRQARHYSYAQQTLRNQSDRLYALSVCVVETELTEDKWVTAYEILPSERDIVHHVIVKVHEKGSMARDAGEGAGGYWAVYVPGNGFQKYPQGFARHLPAGSRISFQIHYTPSGTAKKERMKMGFVFAKDKPQYEVRTVGVANMGIAIPPHAAAHLETKTQRVPFDLPIMSFMAHTFNLWRLDAVNRYPVLINNTRSTAARIPSSARPRGCGAVNHGTFYPSI